jgi:hypothetical protein
MVSHSLARAGGLVRGRTPRGGPCNLSERHHAPLAQLAEQRTLNPWVQGSSPWGRTDRSGKHRLRHGGQGFRQVDQVPAAQVWSVKDRRKRALETHGEEGDVSRLPTGQRHHLPLRRRQRLPRPHVLDRDHPLHVRHQAGVAITIHWRRYRALGAPRPGQRGRLAGSPAGDVVPPTTPTGPRRLPPVRQRVRRPRPFGARRIRAPVPERRSWIERRCRSSGTHDSPRGPGHTPSCSLKIGDHCSVASGPAAVGIPCQRRRHP